MPKEVQEQVTNTFFVCEICGHKFKYRRDAEDCEQDHLHETPPKYDKGDHVSFCAVSNILQDHHQRFRYVGIVLDSCYDRIRKVRTYSIQTGTNGIHNYVREDDIDGVELPNTDLAKYHNKYCDIIKELGEDSYKCCIVGDTLVIHPKYKDRGQL